MFLACAARFGGACFFCFPFYVNRISIPVQTAAHRPKRLGEGGTARCGTSPSAESWELEGFPGTCSGVKRRERGLEKKYRGLKQKHAQDFRTEIIYHNGGQKPKRHHKGQPHCYNHQCNGPSALARSWTQASTGMFVRSDHDSARQRRARSHGPTTPCASKGRRA